MTGAPDSEGRAVGGTDDAARIRDIARLLRSTASVVSATTDVESALQWAVDVVCTYTGWPLGHTFTVDAGTGVLTSNDIWHNENPERFDAFVRATRSSSFAAGVGLPGRILVSGEPAWIMDVRTDPNFPRAAVAEESGLGAGFGFPITSGRGIEGVMEFFAAEPADPDEALLELIGQVGVHLGSLLDRARSDNLRRLAQQELESHQRVLDQIARTEPVGATLEGLCRDIEARYVGTKCSVMLVDAEAGVLRLAAGPSLPPAFRTGIDGLPIADGSGACGTAAAKNEMAVVADTLIDPRTQVCRHLAVAHNLRAVWSHPLTTSAGNVIGTFAVYRPTPHEPDGSEIRTVMTAGSLAALAIEHGLTQAALSAAANVDSLTGLPNRTHFLEQLTGCLHDPAARVAVLYVDLDGFKWINDSLGHPAGDQILIEVAGRLRQALSPEHSLARFGGDEFTVLVTGAGPHQINTIIDRLEAAFSEPFLQNGGEFFLSFAVGVALNDQPTDAYGLIRDADSAMFSAKERGRSRRAMYDKRLRERAVGRVTLESELRRAIERDEFLLHYQPILDLRSGTWVGAEALVRWQHPTRGLLSPASFIPLAEETGLISPLGMHILESVIRQRVAWGTDHQWYASANMSAVQLADPTIGTSVAESLQRYGLDPELLVVEVTETAVMQQLDSAQLALEQISAIGVRVVIDDFGTGYSSIARLGELPMVGVKIDRGFSAGLGVDPKANRVVGAIADLAHALGLEVVVEGIETEVAHSTARILRCDFEQGFLLSPPVPPQALAEVLATSPGR